MKKLILLLIPSIAFAQTTFYPERIVSIYDADTFKITFSAIHPIFGEKIPIRAMGFDAPEIRGKCQYEKELAQKAKAITVNLLSNAETIELRNVQRGKYFRLLADVIIDGKNLKDFHFEAGTARPYDGGKREGWCDGN